MLVEVVVVLLFSLVEVVGHVVRVVQVDDPGRVLEDLETLAGDWKVEGGGQTSSCFRELEDDLLGNTSINVDVKVVGVAILLLVREHILTGGLVEQLEGRVEDGDGSNVGHSEVVLDGQTY